MVKSRVSITVWKKSSRHYTPSRMENLYASIKKAISTYIFSRVPTRYRNTRGSLGELEISWKHSPYVFQLQFHYGNTEMVSIIIIYDLQCDEPTDHSADSSSFFSQFNQRKLKSQGCGKPRFRHSNLQKKRLAAGNIKIYALRYRPRSFSVC